MVDTDGNLWFPDSAHIDPRRNGAQRGGEPTARPAWGNRVRGSRERLLILVYLVLTYLVAAIPFGLVVTTLYGGDVDLRAAGSGNIGATNVARLFGWRLALPVLLLDIGKGFVPVLLAPLVWPDGGVLWGGVVGLVAFLGHCYPAYLEFRGGKGVATGGGAMLALAPIPSLVAVGVWGGLLLVTGRSSVAALGATLGVVVLAGVLQPQVVWVAALLAVGVAIRHVANIRRLMAGEERAVIHPVRWGRRRAEKPSPEELLLQGPSGSEATVPLWREEVVDPLEATDPGSTAG
jgi:glycerol-3-phosphate acyltransferase PlsY